MPVEMFGCQQVSYDCSYRTIVPTDSQGTAAQRDVTFEGASTLSYR